MGLRIALLATLAFVAGGCANLGSLAGGSSTKAGAQARKAPEDFDESSARIVRPEAPVDYDVLVGEFAAREGRYVLARNAFARAVEKDPDSAKLHSRLARFAAQLDERDAALFHAQRAVELDPSDFDARHFLARVERAHGNIEGIERALLDESGQPIDVTASLMLYQSYLESDRLAEALEIARALASEDPENPNGVLAVASIYERMGNTEEAEAALREAISLSDDKLALYGRIARIRRDEGDHDGEIDVYLEVLEEQPGHYGTLVSLGEAYIAADRLAEAIEVYRETVREFPDDMPPLRRLASLYFASERYEEAADLLEQGLEHDPEAWELAYSLGQVQRATGQADAALATLGSIPESHPIYPEARLQMSAVYEEREEFEAALGEVDVVRSLRPSRNLEYHAASLLVRMQRIDEAIRILEVVLAKNPRDAETLYQLGVVYGLDKNVDRALEYMHAALALDPENANVLNYIGYTFAERGMHLDEAESMIRKAMQLRPDDGYITDSLGWVYYMRARTALRDDPDADASGYLKAARQHLTEAAALTGGDPVVSEHLGDVYRLMDDKRRALELYEEAVALEPRIDEQPDLFEKLHDLRQELGVQ